MTRTILDPGDASPPPSNSHRGQTFRSSAIVAGRFEILRLLGRGGMGEVYEALDTELGERVALKTVRPHLVLDEGTLRRFKNEVRLARRITHRNVTRLYDLGFHHGECLFVTMELLEGESLEDHLARRGPLPPAEVLEIVRQLCAALDVAHSAGVIHRDFKPANVMLVGSSPSPDGPEAVVPRRVVVTDFGLAWALDSGAETVVGPGRDALAAPRIQGTPGYLAPELLRGEAVTAAADVFALGVAIYEMLAGCLPWEASTDDDLLRRNLHERPRPIREAKPDVDPRWEAVVHRCLQEDPGARFASSRDLWRAFAGEGSERSESHGVQRIAVWGVETSSERPASAIAQLIATALQAQTVAPVLDAASVRDAVVSLGPQEAIASGLGDSSPRRAEASGLDATRLLRTLGSRHGVDVLLVVSIDEERVLARIHRRCHQTIEIEERADQSRHLGDAVSALVGCVLRAAAIARIAEPGSGGRVLPNHRDASDAYLRGIEALSSQRFGEAVEFMDRSLEFEPTFPLAHSALAEALHALGHESDAALAAQRAFELAIGLPREEQLAIEARFRLLSRERATAIDIYRSLFLLRPENVEHGLALIDALCQSSRGKEALAIAGRLRTHAHADDLRIDLAEARSAEAASEHTQSQAMAGAVREKARAAGTLSVVAEALLIEARASVSLGDGELAESRAREAEELFVQLGNPAGQVSAIRLSGLGLQRQQHLREARARFEESLAVARTIGQVDGVGRALTSIGSVLLTMSDLDGAANYLVEAIRIHREAANLTDLARALRNLANVRRFQSSHRDAVQLFEEAVALAEAEQDFDLAARCLGSLSLAAMDAGDLDRSNSAARAMLALAPRVASKELLPVIHNTVGGILGKSGDVIGAAREYEIALVERQKLPPSGDRSFELAGLAWARLQLCDLDGARTAALEGLAALRDGDRPRDEAMLRIYLAEVHAAAGDPGGADREYRLAESLSASAGDDWTGLTTGLSRANVWTSQGRLEEVERVIPELLAGATAQGRLDAEIVARIIQARCFAGLEQAGEAEAALTVAKVKLSEQGNQSRFYLLHLAITDGLVQSALGRHSEASRLLEEAIRSARDGGLVQLELEARLELGRAELRTGLEAGRARLQALLQEARLRGAGAIVRSVDQLMRAT